jgi:hypothetical protein
VEGKPMISLLAALAATALIIVVETSRTKPGDPL